MAIEDTVYTPTSAGAVIVIDKVYVPESNEIQLGCVMVEPDYVNVCV